MALCAPYSVRLKNKTHSKELSTFLRAKFPTTRENCYPEIEKQGQGVSKELERGSLKEREVKETKRGRVRTGKKGGEEQRRKRGRGWGQERNDSLNCLPMQEKREGIE